MPDSHLPQPEFLACESAVLDHPQRETQQIEETKYLREISGTRGPGHHVPPADSLLNPAPGRERAASLGAWTRRPTRLVQECQSFETLASLGGAQGGFRV